MDRLNAGWLIDWGRLDGVSYRFRQPDQTRLNGTVPTRAVEVTRPNLLNTLRFSALGAPTRTDTCGILVSPLIRHRRIRPSPRQAGNHASQACTAAVRSRAATGDDSDRCWDGCLSVYETSWPYRGANPRALGPRFTRIQYAIYQFSRTCQIPPSSRHAVPVSLKCRPYPWASLPPMLTTMTKSRRGG